MTLVNLFMISNCSRFVVISPFFRGIAVAIDCCDNNVAADPHTASDDAGMGDSFPCLFAVPKLPAEQTDGNVWRDKAARLDF